MSKLLLAALSIMTFSAGAASDRDIDKMTTYSVMLGRAVGCGVDVKKPLERVGGWMDRVFPPGSEDQKIFLPIFVQGMLDNSKSQKNGSSPDTCFQVRSAIGKMNWP